MPDGSQLAFQGANSPFDPPHTLVSSTDVYITNFSTLKRITTVEDAAWSSWSPSGDRIAYTRELPGRSATNGIWTVKPDGSDPQLVLLESDAAMSITDPEWSPDGTKFVFAAIPALQGAGCFDKIFTVNADGSGLTNLVPNAWDCNDTDPSWSPDGTHIVFVRYEYADPSQTVRKRDIFVMDATTGDAGPLAAVTQSLEGADDYGEREPNWRVPSPVTATSTTLQASTNPSVTGEPVTYTATVSAGAGGSAATATTAWEAAGLTPTGTVTFADGGAPLAGCTDVALSGGQATCTVAFASAGPHSVTAAFTPASGVFSGSASAVLAQTVNKAATAISLSVSPAASAFGQQVMLTASASVTPPGGGTPSGSVMFLDGTSVLGVTSLDAAGHATLLTSSLAPGTHGLSAVYGGNGNYASSTSPAATEAVFTVPGAPTGVSATAGNASASVSWSAPSSNGGSPVVGYVITPYAGGVAQPATSVGTVTSATISGLTNGTTYAFKVAARNAVGAGPDSSASNAVTPGAPVTTQAPGAPSGVSASAGNAVANVNWSPPASDGGSAITGYVVTPYIGTTAQAAVTVGNVTSATVPGLTNGTTYTFKVAARNAVGTGPESAASTAVTPHAPLTPPPALRPCVVPNVIRRTLANAKAVIRKAACTVGRITYAPSSPANKGRVVGQTPRPHKKLKHRAKVSLVVGRGRH